MKHLLALAAFALIATACGDHWTQWSPVEWNATWNGDPVECHVEHNHETAGPGDPWEGHAIGQYNVTKNNLFLGPNGWDYACGDITLCVLWQAPDEVVHETCRTDDDDTDNIKNLGASWPVISAIPVGIDPTHGPKTIESTLTVRHVFDSTEYPCEYHDADDSNAANSWLCPAGIPIP